jgi:hypothetical protein
MHSNDSMTKLRLNDAAFATGLSTCDDIDKNAEN